MHRMYTFYIIQYTYSAQRKFYKFIISCYKLNRCFIKLSLVNILENVFVFIEILFKMLLFKGGVLIYAEHFIYTQ